VSTPLAYSDVDVAFLLHVSKRTVYRLRKSGALRAIRIGRAVRIPADSLAQFLERAGSGMALDAAGMCGPHQAKDASAGLP
jgi:excisionase family DNA binding protein